LQTKEILGRKSFALGAGRILERSPLKTSGVLKELEQTGDSLFLLRSLKNASHFTSDNCSSKDLPVVSVL
jgi:hypothetical protein